MNTLKVLSVSRPNPNPNNIEGKAVLNGWDVLFSLQEKPNGKLEPRWLITPEHVNIKRVYKCGYGNPEFYALQSIIKEINSNNLLKNN